MMNCFKGFDHRQRAFLPFVVPPHDITVGRFQTQHIISRRHTAPLGQDGQRVAAPGHGHVNADFRIDLRPGMQHMDGKTAMQYVRYRDEEGDIGRIRRQQKFIMALYKQIASKNIIAKMPGVSKQIMSMIKTDLSLKEMVELGNVMRGMMEKDGLKMSMVPGEPKYIDGISYWIPDIPKMRQQMADMQGVKITEKFNENTKKLEQEYKNPAKK